jgi:hypothetical protein
LKREGDKMSWDTDPFGDNTTYYHKGQKVTALKLNTGATIEGKVDKINVKKGKFVLNGITYSLAEFKTKIAIIKKGGTPYIQVTRE